MSTLAVLAFIVPLSCGVLAALAAPGGLRRVALSAAFAGPLAAATLLTVLLAHHHRGPLVVWLGGWHPRGGVAIGIDLAVDRTGLAMALFCAVLALVAAIVSARLIVVSPCHYQALSLLFVGAMIAFCLTGDLFDLFVFFELMSVSAYVLVGYEVRQRAALEGALTFAVTNTIGSILLLFGIILIYGETNALNLALIGRDLHHATTTTTVAFALIASGFLIKAAAVPFHFWVADAYAVAPTPVCIMLAGAYSELGLFGLARVWWTAFEPALGGHAATFRAIFVVLGLLTGLTGGLLALAQHHLKRMLAFVVIGQIGLMLVGIGLLTGQGIGGVAVLLIGDGLVKAALFVAVAVVQHRYDTVDVERLHGCGRELPHIAAVFGVGALAIAGVPPFGPFVGRALIEDAALRLPGYHWVPVVLAVVSALSGAALIRAGLRVFAGRGATAPVDRAADRDDQETADEVSDTPRATSAVLWAPAIALLVAGLAWGVLPGLVSAAAGAGAQFTDAGGYAAAVLDGHARATVTPAAHWPGLTGLAYAAASTLAAIALALAGLRNPRLPAWLAGGIDRLRALHSGHPGDYVVFAACGATTLSGLFAVLVR